MRPVIVSGETDGRVIKSTFALIDDQYCIVIFDEGSNVGWKVFKGHLTNFNLPEKYLGRMAWQLRIENVTIEKELSTTLKEMYQ